MHTVTFGIGIGEDEHGHVLTPGDTMPMIGEAMRIVSREYGGCFLTRGEGAWIAPDGRLVRESGITITASTPRDAGVRDHAARVADSLRCVFLQAAVHVAIAPACSWCHGTEPVPAP